MREIILSNSPTPAIVDDMDYASVAGFRWYASNQGYAIRAQREPRPSRKMCFIRMHRLIVDAPAGLTVDHANGDRLDNRRTNLRACTQSQNMGNSKSHHDARSRFKGVARHSDGKKWMAQIMARGISYYLGCFSDEVEAAIAYDVAARNHFGEFARTNFGMSEVG